MRELDERPAVFDVGREPHPPGEVPVDVEACVGDDVEVWTFVFHTLDPDRLVAYETLAEGVGGTGGDLLTATLWLAGETFIRIEGPAVPDDVLRAYGSTCRWLLESVEGMQLALAVVPRYVARSSFGPAALRRVAIAAEWILKTTDEGGATPYHRDRHVCSRRRSVWADRRRTTLVAENRVPREVGKARPCSACAFERKMWGFVIKWAGHAKYGRLAFAGFHLEQMGKLNPKARMVSVRQYELVSTVHSERQRFEEKRVRDAEAKAAKAGGGKR